MCSICQNYKNTKNSYTGKDLNICDECISFMKLSKNTFLNDYYSKIQHCDASKYDYFYFMEQYADVLFTGFGKAKRKELLSVALCSKKEYIKQIKELKKEHGVINSIVSVDLLFNEISLKFDVTKKQILERYRIREYLFTKYNKVYGRKQKYNSEDVKRLLGINKLIDDKWFYRDGNGIKEIIYKKYGVTI